MIISCFKDQEDALYKAFGKAPYVYWIGILILRKYVSGIVFSLERKDGVMITMLLDLMFTLLENKNQIFLITFFKFLYNELVTGKNVQFSMFSF